LDGGDSERERHIFRPVPLAGADESGLVLPPVPAVPPDFRAAHFLQQNPENPEFSFSLLDRHILFVIINLQGVSQKICWSC